MNQRVEHSSMQPGLADIFLHFFISSISENSAEYLVTSLIKKMESISDCSKKGPIFVFQLTLEFYA